MHPLAARFGRLALLLLVGTVVALPWSFAGVDPFSRRLVLAALFAIGLLALPTVRTSAQSPGLTRLELLVAGLLLLGPCQLVSINSLTQLLSPQAVSGRQSLVGVPGAEFPLWTEAIPIPRDTISLAPAATRSLLLSWVAAAAVLFLTRHLLSSAGDRRIVLWAIAINGAALAYFGLVQRLTGNGEIYGWIPAEGSTPFGPFINRNSGAGYLVLSLASVVGLLLDDPTKRVSSRPRWTNAATIAVGLPFVLAAVMVAGIVGSLSRGGLLGLVMASVALIFATGAETWRATSFTSRQLTRHWQLLVGVAVTVVLATALVTWIQLSSEASTRIASLWGKETRDEQRWQLWEESLAIARDFARAGSGLGTFGFIQPSYQQRLMGVWNDHAENQYLELLVEGGIPAAVALALGLVLFALKLHERWNSRDPGHHAMGLMGIFVLVGQMTCAVFDFGLILPANLCLLATMVGLIAAKPTPDAPSRLSRLGIGVTLLLLAALAWAFGEAGRAGRIDAAIDRGVRKIVDKDLDPTEVATSIARLEAYLRDRPDDVEGQLRLAELWMTRYRLAARDQLSARHGDQIDAETLWEFTSPLVLHKQAVRFMTAADQESLAELRSQPVVRDNLVPALRHLLLARAACPWHDRPHLLLAQLSFLAADPGSDAVHLERAVRLAPGDPEVWYWSGVLHQQSGRLDPAYAAWKKALSYSPVHTTDVLNRLSDDLSIEQILDQVLPESAAMLVELAGRLDARPADQALLGARALIALKREQAGVAPSSDSLALRARAHRYRGDVDEAITNYRAALKSAPRSVPLRLELAMYLRQLDRQEEALTEARIALRFGPTNDAATKLYQELTDPARQTRQP